ncbi:MAG TPA: aminotransferase class I/II-fold pyridoxal phosphate-dependent enzyme [Solirubrobacteraceae bacterium]|jgi:histidinol-phosphate/aromatic aminotransferase/cobyric acid decarboxylase-like protein
MSVQSSAQITPREEEILATLKEIKAASGSHSPSLFALSDRIPDLQVRIDACFLSNPYATDLFIDRLTSELVETGAMRKVLEAYPSPNNHVASLLSPTLGVDPAQIFVCNGAIEAIQAAMHRFAGTRVGVILPTFSPYYEYLRPDQQVFYYKLSRENDFALDVDHFREWVLANELDTVCLINPNNPNGGYVPTKLMRGLLESLAHLELVVLDESFIDFAWEDAERHRTSLTADAAAQENVMLVKSMSKDFGVAGLRAGYAIMSADRVQSLVGNGFLWNISGLTEYFFRLFTDPEFQADYSWARLRYLAEAEPFFGALGAIGGLRAYPSKANFVLVELEDTVPIELVAPLLLVRHGVYVRDCRDKIGLEDGQYIRVASRKGVENDEIVAAFESIVSACRTDG